LTKKHVEYLRKHNKFMKECKDQEELRIHMLQHKRYMRKYQEWQRKQKQRRQKQTKEPKKYYGDFSEGEFKTIAYFLQLCFLGFFCYLFVADLSVSLDLTLGMAILASCCNTTSSNNCWNRWYI